MCWSVSVLVSVSVGKLLYRCPRRLLAMVGILAVLQPARRPVSMCLASRVFAHLRVDLHWLGILRNSVFSKKFLRDIRSFCK